MAKWVGEDMKASRQCTQPNYIPNSIPPNCGSSIDRKQLKLSIADMDIFKDIINIIIELVEDESVDKNIRMRYFDKLAKVIAIEDYHINYKAGGQMKAGRIISDISKRVLIVEGKSELDRILHLEENRKEHIINVKRLGSEVYEIELIRKVGSFYKAGD